MFRRWTPPKPKPINPVLYGLATIGASIITVSFITAAEWAWTVFWLVMCSMCLWMFGVTVGDYYDRLAHWRRLRPVRILRRHRRRIGES